MAKTSLLAAGMLAGLLTACSSSLPGMPQLPALPDMPSLPSVSIPGFSQGALAGDADCAGSWRLDGQGGLAVTSSQDGLRWRTLDGQTGQFVPEKDGWQAYSGWTDQPEERQIQFNCADGLSVFEGLTAHEAPVIRHETVFTGAKGTQLSGRLILPAGDEPVPVLVQVQGWGKASALLHDPFQHLLPMQGVGVFIYDARGTGASKGDYTQDFSLLATDAAAAAAEARRLAGQRLGRLGLHGISQGGWAAPMAAMTTRVDFMIVSNGLLESPLAENRARSVMDVAAAGFGPEAQMAAGLLADAAGGIVSSGFRRGYAELEALKKIYRDEPWYRHVQGEFTGDVLRTSDAVLRVTGPMRIASGTLWTHDGEPVLRQLGRLPVLWVLAGADRTAPPDYTRAPQGASV